VFLECLLTGAGYDAYIVSGIAPYFITQCDLTQTQCPNTILQQCEWKQDKSSEEDNSSGFQIPDYYKLETNNNNNSNNNNSSSKTKNNANIRYDDYLKQKQETMKLQQEIELAKLCSFEQKQLFDPLKNKRIHFWILVKSGQRGISDSFFIESTTGKIYNFLNHNSDNDKDEECPYIRIESVWNEKNYWVNVQYKHTTKKKSKSESEQKENNNSNSNSNQRELKSISEMRFDFHNSKHWEFILFDEQHQIQAVADNNTNKTD
jgi:hypothetical protein